MNSGNCTTGEYPSHWVKGVVSVQDLTENIYIPIYQHSQSSIPAVFNNSFQLSGNSTVNNIFVNFKKNHQYKFYLNLNK